MPVTIRALEHHAAFMKATNRDERPVLTAAEFRPAQRKEPTPEEPAKVVKKRRA